MFLINHSKKPLALFLNSVESDTATTWKKINFEEDRFPIGFWERKAVFFLGKNSQLYSIDLEIHVQNLKVW